MPGVTCLALRCVEAWKLWDEMSRGTALGVLAWTWAVVFVAAALVTTFHLDDRRSLRCWEFLIDASNVVISIMIALDCAERPTGLFRTYSYGRRFLLLLVICLIPQFIITFAARRARHVAGRVRHQLRLRNATAGQRTAAGPPKDLPARPVIMPSAAPAPQNEDVSQEARVLVG